MESKFTAVFRKVPEGYIGFVEELPGANTQGATLEEARENLREAVSLVLDANRALAGRSSPIPTSSGNRSSSRREAPGPDPPSSVSWLRVSSRRRQAYGVRQPSEAKEHDNSSAS